MNEYLYQRVLEKIASISDEELDRSLRAAGFEFEREEDVFDIDALWGAGLKLNFEFAVPQEVIEKEYDIVIFAANDDSFLLAA